MSTNEYTKQQIGGRLLFLRTRAGLTIEDVAALLSTSPARYTMLENGENMASEDEEMHADELMILCEHYGIGIDDFLGTAQQANLESLVDGLSLEDKKVISEVIKKTLK